MKIAEVTEGSKRIDLVVKVIEKEEIRNVNTRFGPAKVANAVIEDDSGNMVLVLWGDETEKINEGDNIKIDNGYVKSWNGSLQLSVGKFGKLTVL